MPKIRTNRGAVKRFKLTGRKKVKHKKAYASHILTKKTSKRKRKLRKVSLVAQSEIKRIKRMLSV